MKTTLQLTLSVSILLIGLNLFAQDMKLDENQIKNDVIKVNYNKKSARKAMLFSSIFPGAGQFYVSKKSWTAYVFSAIEIGLFYGFFDNNKKGKDKTDEYEHYADQHYDRTRQHAVESDMITFFDDNYPNNVYTHEHFRLDDENTQHFYEDIGKYDKYIFGWDDWFETYAGDPNAFPTTGINVHWVHESNPDGQGSGVWIGNYPLDESQAGYDTPYSANRKVYINMRQDAEDFFETADHFSWAIVANHIVSGIHAAYTTHKYNATYLSSNKPKMYFSAYNYNGKPIPMIGINTNF